MRKCPWCGRENLNVYAYCQGCGRGWAGPPWAEKPKDRRPSPWRRLWILGRRKAA